MILISYTLVQTDSLDYNNFPAKLLQHRGVATKFYKTEALE